MKHIVLWDNPQNKQKKLQIFNKKVYLIWFDIHSYSTTYTPDVWPHRWSFVTFLSMLKAMHQVLLATKHQPISSWCSIIHIKKVLYRCLQSWAEVEFSGGFSLSGERKDKNISKMHINMPLLWLLSYKNTIEYCTVHIILSQDGRRSIWIVNSCKFKMAIHYERAARSEATIQKTVAKKFLKRGDGGMREEEEQTQRVSVKCACVIAVTSSLRVLHLFPVCSKGRCWCWSMGTAAEALCLA